MFGLRRESITHVGHVTNVDGGIPNRLMGKVVQFRDRLRTAVQIDVILELADLRKCRREESDSGR